MNRAIRQCTFARVPVGGVFYQNGNAYKKVSTRTAHILEYNRRFYFSAKEWVTIDELTFALVMRGEA